MNFKIKYSSIYIFCLAFVLMAFPVSIYAQQKKGNAVRQDELRIVVTDEAGHALAGVKIIIGEGEKYASTDHQGVASFNASVADPVTISLDGYQDLIIAPKDLVAQPTVVLRKQRYMKTNSDQVNIPFGDIMKRNITGSSQVITAEQLEKYPGTDIRNALTGLAVGLEIRELNGAPGINEVERLNASKMEVLLRGRSPMYIIDGTPTDVTEMPLDPSEIETVTVIKDIVSKAMFGPVGADGIIMVKTKRGKVNHRIIQVNAEKGVNIVDRMPNWVNGADYARLNNLARSNSGLPTLYTDDAIAKYEVNDGYDMYYPSNNYRSMVFKNTRAYNRANISTYGGNEGLRYYSYLGYSGEGDIYKIGKTADYNRIISRSNLDVKINDYLNLKLGIYGALSIRRSPNYGAGTEYMSINSALSDANTIPAIAFPVYANNSPSLEKPWYAVTSTYGYNPIGGLMGKGFFTDMGRSGASNIEFDYDMSHLLKGLKSETYVGFNVFNQVRKGKAEDYAAYIAKRSLTASGNDTILLTKVHDGVDQANLSKLTDYYYQRFAVSQTFKHEAKIGKFDIQNSLTYFVSKVTRDGYEDSQRENSLIWSGLLNYDDKYMLQAVVNRAGTYSFAENNRYATFPSVGAAWVVTEEKFMKALPVINYLKLRAEAGILGYDNFQAPFYYRDNYTTNNTGQAFGPYSTNTWFGTATESSVYRTTQSRAGNPDLTFEKRREFNAGIDATLFKNKLAIEVNYYNQLRDGIISQITSVIPDVVGLSSVLPKYNYNKIRYFGLEAGLSYTEHIGDFQFTLGGNATVQNSKYEKIDELNYINKYQSKLGQPVDAIYGLNCLGRFQTDAETTQVPQLFDDVLHAGDLKYKDMNNDKVVDDNDKSMIGHSAPRLYFGLNLVLKYKGFELDIMGTGRAFYDIPLTNSYFWNGWGDNNYSNFVRNNIGGDYPRLTYNKVNNNFIMSNFWLAKGDYFKIQNVQLSYSLPEKLLKKINLRGASIFVKGANLYTFSAIKEVDPESIDSGVSTYPLYMNITSGIKLTF